MKKSLFLLAALFLFSSTAIAQDPVLPPIQESIELGFQPFPYVRKLRKVCKKRPAETFCARVEQFDAAQAVKKDYCSNEGSKLAECAEWKLDKKCKSLGWWARWYSSCKALKKKINKEKREFNKICRNDPARPFCEGYQYRNRKRR